MKTLTVVSSFIWLGSAFLTNYGEAWLFASTAQPLSTVRRNRLDWFTKRNSAGAVVVSRVNDNANDNENDNAKTGAIGMDSYTHDNYWKVSYRSIEPSITTSENASPILFIHPVGIGLSSWFWEPLMTAMNMESQNNGNSKKISMYAPNLIGCGTQEGSDPWEPNVRGLSFPLGWVQGCESLMQHVEQKSFKKKSMGNFFQRRQSNNNNNNNHLKTNKSSHRKWTIVVQGGLAPVGILLAARNPEWVERLVLTSPPTWKEMTTAVPQVELERNYNFLKSKVLGQRAFELLESRWAVQFFSNAFLFSKPCTDTWLAKAAETACVEDRPPVWAFNAGLLQHRSYEEELTKLLQVPTLILSGQDDKRSREEYSSQMNDCEIVKVPGTTNVAPWESPQEVARILIKSIGF